MALLNTTGRSSYRLTLPIVVIGLLFFVSSWIQRGAGGTGASTEKAIRKVLKEQVDSWNERDLRGFMAGYWQNEGLRFYSGSDVQKGWHETFQRYRRRYQGKGQEMGTLEFKNIEVEVISNDAAFARGQWHLSFRSKKDMSGLFTLFFRKKDQGWCIVHDHTSK